MNGAYGVGGGAGSGGAFAGSSGGGAGAASLANGSASTASTAASHSGGPSGAGPATAGSLGPPLVAYGDPAASPLELPDGVADEFGLSDHHTKVVVGLQRASNFNQMPLIW